MEKTVSNINGFKMSLGLVFFLVYQMNISFGQHFQSEEYDIHFKDSSFCGGKKIIEYYSFSKPNNSSIIESRFFGLVIGDTTKYKNKNIVLFYSELKDTFKIYLDGVYLKTESINTVERLVEGTFNTYEKELKKNTNRNTSLKRLCFTSYGIKRAWLFRNIFV